MSKDGLDIESLLALNAMGAHEQYDDDDDESLADYDPDDDEAFGEFDDDDEESFAEFGGVEEADFDDDDGDDEALADSYMGEDMSERRRRRHLRRSWLRPRYRSIGRRRRIGKVRGSRTTTLRSPTGQRMRVRFGKSYATSAEVNKLIKDTEKKFADAMKERKANYNRLSKQISKATRNLDSKVARVRRSVKKLEGQGQNSVLMSLLQGQPKVKTIKFPDSSGDGIIVGQDLEATVEFEKQDILLPLLMSGGLGGGGGGDNTLLLALAFSNRD